MTERSWIDIGTNFVALEGQRWTYELLQSMLEPGSAPRDVLPSYLHEATHHWTFLTPVGQALAHLRLRAGVSTILYHAQSEDPNSPFHTGVSEAIRYCVGVEALKPLVEGIALFMEFAGVSRRSNGISPPMRSAVALFGEPVGEDEHGKFVTAAEAPGVWRTTHEALLLAMRMEEATVARKLNVLCSPLTADPDRYLLGYLAVCSLRRHLINQGCLVFEEESDFFVTFILSFFFWDAALVEILLGDASSVTLAGSAELIRDHISNRIRALISEVSSTDVDEFERWLMEVTVAGEQNTGWGPPPRGLAHRAEGRSLDEIFKEVDQRTADNTAAGRVRNEDVFTPVMAHRNLLCLAARAVEIERASSEAFVILDGERVVTLAANAAAHVSDGGTVRGSIMAVIDTNIVAPVPVLVVSDERSILHVVAGAYARLEALPLEALEKLEGKPPTGGNFAAAFWAPVEAVLRQLPDSVRVLDRIDAATVGLWQPIALLSVLGSPEKYDALEECMSDTGLFEVLGGDAGILDAYVRASLVASVAPFPGIVQLALEREGYRLTDVVNAVRSARSVWGEPCVWGDPERWHSRVWLAP